MPLLSSIASASVRGFSGYGLSSGATFISASGGTTVDSGNYRYHTFSSSGTFTVSAAPAGKFIDFIIVAGGGGAATSGGGAGGGGGGVVEELGQSISTGSFSVTIGSGGALGSPGGNSLFKGKTALGGGQGNGSGVGYAGGSGGGGTSGGGAALQPTSASGGYGNAGSNAAGGGAGSAASGNNSGDGYTSTTFNDIYSEGGPLDDIHAGPGSAGSGGGVNTDVGIAYPGANGIVIIRYLFQ